MIVASQRLSASYRERRMRRRIPRPRQDTSAAILVGGYGRRLGTVDKARIMLGGTENPFLFAIATKILGEVKEVVMVGRADQSYPNPIVPLIRDNRAGTGPMGGLAAALAYVTTPWCLLLACDLPFYDASLLHALTRARREGADAVVARTQGGLEPTASLYSQRILPRLSQGLHDGRYGLQRFIRSLSIVEVTICSSLEAKLENINTKQQLERLSGPHSLSRFGRQGIGPKREG